MIESKADAFGQKLEQMKEAHESLISGSNECGVVSIFDIGEWV